MMNKKLKKLSKVKEVEMKKIIVTLVCMISLLVASVGCGEGRAVNGKYCDTYGLLNKEELKCEGVQYKTIVGNVFWGIVFIETIFVPIYFFGFSLYEPVGG
jgi:hypothetical protein